MNKLKWNGERGDVVDGVPVPGGVTWWFKQDEIHAVTHVHHGPEFLPWHRLLMNWSESLLRVIDPRLSLHYWDWTKDPRRIPDANLGGGRTGELNLFTDDFMGYGGPEPKQPIGPVWKAAGFYDEHANPARLGPFDQNYNAADTPTSVDRSVGGVDGSQFWAATEAQDLAIMAADDYAIMRAGRRPDGSFVDGLLGQVRGLEGIHDRMPGSSIWEGFIPRSATRSCSCCIRTSTGCLLFGRPKIPTGAWIPIMSTARKATTRP